MKALHMRLLVTFAALGLLLSSTSGAGADTGGVVSYLSGFQGGYVDAKGIDGVPYQVSYTAASGTGLLTITETTTYGQYDPSQLPLLPCQGYAPITRTLQFNPSLVTVSPPAPANDGTRQVATEHQWSVQITNTLLPVDPTKMPAAAPPMQKMRLTTAYSAPACTKTPKLAMPGKLVPVQSIDNFPIFFDSQKAAETFFALAQPAFYVPPTLANASAVAVTVSKSDKAYTFKVNATVITPHRCDVPNLSPGSAGDQQTNPVYFVVLTIPAGCNESAKPPYVAPLSFTTENFTKNLMVVTGGQGGVRRFWTFTLNKPKQ